MKIKDLIGLLAKYDEESEVAFKYGPGYFALVKDVRLCEVYRDKRFAEEFATLKHNQSHCCEEEIVVLF